MRPVTGDAVLFNHVALANARQRLPYVDPGLPSELLPARWTGKDSTPFLLARVTELTGGDSLAANIQLVLNNARLAAAIAIAYAELAADTAGRPTPLNA